jgi:hypothetical protein
MQLHFTDDLGPRHFEFCFVGFVLGGSLQQTKSMAVLRREVGLFEKLEAISVLKPCGKKMVNGEPERQLDPDGPRAVEMELPEFDLLYNYMSAVPWQTGTPAKQAVEALTAPKGRPARRARKGPLAKTGAGHSRPRRSGKPSSRKARA